MEKDMVSRKRYHHIADPMRYYKQMLPFRMARQQRGGKFSLGKLKKLVAKNVGPSAAPLVKKGIDYSLKHWLLVKRNYQNMQEKSPCWKACTKHRCKR